MAVSPEKMTNVGGISGANAQIGEGNQQYNHAGGQGGTANNKFEQHFHVAPESPLLGDGRGSISLAAEIKHLTQERDHHVLESLKQLFRDGRGEEPSKKTRAFDIYNDTLKKYNAALAYRKEVHVLFVDDNPIDAKQVLKEISSMIKSSSATAAVSSTSSALPQSPTAVEKRRPSGIKDFTKKDERGNTLDALKELKRFFLEQRDAGEKSQNFAAYEQCLTVAHKNAELIYRQKDKEHVLRVDDKDVDPKAAVEVIQQMINTFVTPVPPPPPPSYSSTTLPQFEATKSALKANAIDSKEVKEFLRFVAEGEQDKAEAMLQKNPALALVSEDVTDLSKRTFTNITAFQYAVWALDWHMWTMIRKYLPDDEAKKQAEGFETGSWVRQHGLHAQHLLNNLVEALRCANALYNAGIKAHSAGNAAWIQQVGGAQCLLPAHVVNEYCHPRRSFEPCPDFKDTSVLSRTRKSDAKPTKEWFTGLYNDGSLGEKYAYIRAAREESIARRGMGDGLLWERYPAWTHLLSADAFAVATLSSTRMAQREKLITEVRARNVQRSKAA